MIQLEITNHVKKIIQQENLELNEKRPKHNISEMKQKSDINCKSNIIKYFNQTLKSIWNN